MSKSKTPADCQKVQVKVTYTEVFFLLDYCSIVTESIFTSLTPIYFSSLDTQEHSWSRLQNTTNNGHKLWPFFSHFEIFLAKIVKNMILRNTRVSISEKGIDCVLL